MNCPDCHQHMRCADSRDVATRTFGEARRRRYHCVCGKRYSTAEIIIAANEGKQGVKSASIEVFLRNLVDGAFRERVRSFANSLLNEAGGK